MAYLRYGYILLGVLASTWMTGIVDTARTQEICHEDLGLDIDHNATALADMSPGRINSTPARADVSPVLGSAIQIGSNTTPAHANTTLTWASMGQNDSAPDEEYDAMAQLLFDALDPFPRWRNRLFSNNLAIAKVNVRIHKWGGGTENWIFPVSVTNRKCLIEGHENVVIVRVNKPDVGLQKPDIIQTLCLTDWAHRRLQSHPVAGLGAWSVRGEGSAVSAVSVMPKYGGDVDHYWEKVMPLVEWDKPDTVAIFKNFVLQAADGMEAIMNENIVLTDVKPANMLYKCLEGDDGSIDHGACRFDYSDLGGGSKEKYHELEDGSIEKVVENIDIITPYYVPPRDLFLYFRGGAPKHQGVQLYGLGTMVFELAANTIALEEFDPDIKDDAFNKAIQVPMRARKLLNELGADQTFIDAVLALLLGEGPETEDQLTDLKQMMKRQHKIKHEEHKKKYIDGTGEDKAWFSCWRQIWAGYMMQMPEFEYMGAEYNIEAGKKGLYGLQAWAKTRTEGATVRIRRPSREDLGLSEGCSGDLKTKIQEQSKKDGSDDCTPECYHEPLCAELESSGSQFDNQSDDGVEHSSSKPELNVHESSQSAGHWHKIKVNWKKQLVVKALKRDKLLEKKRTAHFDEAS